MPSPLISVIIPTYNRVTQVQAAIDSVLKQSFTDYELIVVDDCSTDKTNEVLGKKLGTFPHTTLITLDENHGVSHARNCGLKAAQGEWVAFLDSDDIWHREKLQKQIEFINENPNIKILQAQEIWVRNGVRVNAPKTHRKKSGDIFNASLKRCMITPSSVMIHKTLFDKYGIFNEAFPACEDYDLWLRISAFEEVGLVDELLMTRFGGAEDQLSYTVQLQDKYRIESIKQLIDKREISRNKWEQALKIFLKKCSILSNGALKRGNQVRYKKYKSLIDTYSQLT